MKRLFFSFLIFCISMDASAATVLKPSLNAQMQKQSIQDRKAKNATRLVELRNHRATQSKTTIVSNTTKSTKTGAIIASSTTTTKTVTNTPSPVIFLSSQPPISGVDMVRIRTTWLIWYNNVRKNIGVNPYSYDARLDRTAYDWNKVFASQKGQNLHRRSPGDAFYDYPKITAWFASRGVVGKVKGGVTATENVGWGTYSCSSNDCTDSLISSIRTTFDFFMREKSYSGAHYRSIVQPNFSKIGLSIIVVPSERRYYLVVHFITE